ncbi:hypothetical protein PR048_002388 [Dryococelus australis]|uniref:Uncharacterized protein n=1 Tax=Dryococelus australis TaxID=614101 RepID=A0ABQ9IK57_9NEOP|nr:hypothetical protein PR048_002388 [Dryococelus australis]
MYVYIFCVVCFLCQLKECLLLYLHACCLKGQDSETPLLLNLPLRWKLISLLKASGVAICIIEHKKLKCEQLVMSGPHCHYGKVNTEPEMSEEEFQRQNKKQLFAKAQP